MVPNQSLENALLVLVHVYKLARLHVHEYSLILIFYQNTP